MGASLDIADLTLRFGGVTALNGLTLSLSPGAVLGLAGPNGSGKSSLINVLTGHYAAEGMIRLDGRRIEFLAAPERARLGMTRTFQTPRAYQRMSILENLRAACHARQPVFRGRAARRREKDDMHEVLARYGLERHAQSLPDMLTQSELRRLELARADISGARLLLIDEPAAGASDAEADTLLHMISTHLVPGRTVILIEHRIDFLRALCTEIVVLQAGRPLARGLPDKVFASPKVRECLIGEPANV